jgi:hypothetical protein
MYWVISLDQREVVAGSFATESEALDWIRTEREIHGKNRWETLIVEKDEPIND